MPPILQLDLQQILSQAVSFMLLVWVLRRFAWRPLLGALDARRQRIEEGFRQVAQSRVELERLQQDVTQRLAKIDDEARAKIQQAILEGKRIAGEIQEQARAQSQVIIAKSKDAIDLELAKAKVTLRDDMAQMTVEAVSKLLRQKVDQKTDEQLIAQILDELGQSTKT